MTAQAAEASVAETRYLPWLARFRCTGRGEAELQLERADGGPDPRASTAAAAGLKVATRGMFYDREQLARELGLESIPEGDAGLVLEAFRRWGQNGIRRLRGVFVVFIWDGDRDRFLAAHDQLGYEPLLYAQTGEEILFAASPRTLLAQPGVRRAPNPTVLAETLYWQWPVPEDTALEGIRRVLPGHILTVTNGRASSNRYWNPSEDREEQGWVEADALDEFDALLERSVSRCLELGPTSIFLSGGLDSVSIAAVALDLAKRRELPTPLALSLAFPTPESSEEDVQLGVATALGLPQIMLGLEESVAPDGLIGRALELCADWPLPQTYIWSGAYQELAKTGVEHGARVIMTGGGGDEWLTVDLRIAADFIEALQFRNLYHFTRSRLASFAVPTTKALRYVLWEYGLEEVLRFHARTLLAKHAPSVLRGRRRRRLARAELPWLAPDPRLRAEVRARREEEADRMVDRMIVPRKVGGRFRFYAADGQTGPRPPGDRGPTRRRLRSGETSRGRVAASLLGAGPHLVPGSRAARSASPGRSREGSCQKRDGAPFPKPRLRSAEEGRLRQLPELGYGTRAFARAPPPWRLRCAHRARGRRRSPDRRRYRRRPGRIGSARALPRLATAHARSVGERGVTAGRELYSAE